MDEPFPKKGNLRIAKNLTSIATKIYNALEHKT